ncbi:ABC transporter permease [Oceanobacillus saliphilus]|uniref:ABC transporter permease n=1 Tax=Oceanobacillus saliphilus TaxID=2925834 RepID=UPI00201E71CF|nr:ABC transporter permease [Oceanobacillus saliphilus]
MIGQIVKKQLLILLRNPVQILLLVGLPIILIAILSMALGGTMSGEAPKINLKIAFLEHGDEEEQIDRFVSDIEQSALPDEATEAIRSNTSQVAPIRILKDHIFGSDDLEAMIEFHVVEPGEREQILNDSSYTAVVEVPENFTYEALGSMVLGGAAPALQISVNDEQQLGSHIVTQILESFQEQLTLGTFLGKKGMDEAVLQVEETFGEVSIIAQKNPITTQGYYTVGMAVMNVLFIASTLGSIAFMEKKTHVFDRMILGNISRWTYFIGVFVSSSLFGFIHLLIVYGFSWIVFGVKWPDLVAFFLVTMAYAIAIGGITVLLTAISYRINSEVITNFFSAIVVTFMAVLGGSFFPIGDSSAVIRMLGNLTPNGAGMSSYLTILRGDGISEISHHLLFMFLFALLSITIAAISFPKRRAS